MVDTGHFQINDLVFNIPPDQIQMQRKSHTNFWSTLRTRSSQKLRSGYSEIHIAVSLNLTDTRDDFFKLSDLVSQIRVTPFVWVENEFIRNSVLGGLRGKAMVLALKQMEIVKTAGTPNLIQVSMHFCWFNYAPYMRDFVFKEDLFLSKPVRNPRDSAAWELLYKAEQRRGNYIRRKSLSGKGTELATSEYTLVEKKNYIRLKEDVLALHRLAQELRDAGVSTTQSSEFVGIPKNVFDKLSKEVGEKKLLRLEREAFGYNTSMGGFDSEKVAIVLKNLINAKKAELEEMGTLVSLSGVWEPVQVLDDRDRTTVFEYKARADLKREEVQQTENKVGTDKVLMRRLRVLNLDALNIIPTGISISFNNILATVPLIGHPYPTYQHIGSIDAVVTLSVITTNEDAIKSLSAFYSLCEDQARKFRQVPAGFRNISVFNDLVNMCGLHEFVLDNLSTSSVKGQPGSYTAVLTLIDNPVTSDTKESLSPGQSFTTSQDIREAILNVLLNHIEFNKEAAVFNADPGPFSDEIEIPIKSQVTFDPEELVGTTDVGTVGQVLTSVSGLGIVGRTAVGVLSSIEETSPIYRYTGDQSERNRSFSETCKRLVNRMGVAFAELLAALQTATYEKNLTAFFLLNNNDIMGIKQFQEDAYDLISETERFDDIFSPGAGRPKPITRKSHSPLVGDLGLSAKVQASITEGISQTKKNTRRAIEIWQQLSEASSSEQRIEALKEAQTLREDRAELTHKFVDEALRSWNEFIIDFIDKLSRSTVMQLDQFESVRELLRNRAMVSGANAYPDFPLQQVVDHISRDSRYEKAIEILQRTGEEKGIAFRNINLSALINPDFYIFNSRTDSASDIIGTDVIQAAKDAIISAQSDPRIGAEKHWLQEIYEKRVLGTEKAQRVIEDMRKGGGGLVSQEKLDNERNWIKENGTQEQKDQLAEIERREEIRSYEHYSELQGFVACSIAELKETDEPLLLRGIDGNQDKFNATGLRRKELVPAPPPNSGQCKHRFDVSEALNWLPASAYEGFTRTLDGNKDPVFAWPTTNQHNTELSSKFGVIRSFGGPPHRGIDIISKGGKEETLKLQVLASADGVIEDISTEEEALRVREGYWESINKQKEPTIFVRVRHSNGWRTVYKHMIWEDNIRRISRLHHGWEDSETGVSHSPQTVPVAQGGFLGWVGSTGYSTGPHLHFEIRRGIGQVTVVDPLIYLDGSHIKLQGPTPGVDPNNESLFTKSIEQLEKNILNNSGYSLMRAYPTFKLYFIESDLGERKKFAFDDFFSYSHVAEIQMVRSRKIPADLVVIHLTNVSGILSNRKFQGSSKESQPHDERGQVVKEDPLDAGAKNTVKESNIHSLMLQAGTQVQLRLGYHNNPDELSKVFNGIITDVQFSGSDDMVTIVCQSFAIELTQNIYGEIKSFGGWFSSSGQTGKILEELMSAPEAVHFGRWKTDSKGRGNSVRSILTDRWTIVPQPQDDNIFAPTGNRGLLGIFDGSPDYILYQSTIWDVFQEMTLRHPGYIASPVPYDGEGPRMTMFFGVPDQLYFARDPSPEERITSTNIRDLIEHSHAEDAGKLLEEIRDATRPNSAISKKAKSEVKDGRPPLDAQLRELWIRNALLRLAKDRGFIKPFRGYHVLTSTTNIIDNKISSTAWNTFNTVTLQYEDDAPKANEETRSVGFQDAETFTMMIDAALPDEDKKEMFAQFPNCVGWEMAKRYCTALLKSTIREGYRGSIIIMGNPDIKPYDICYVFDEYTDMYGPIEVEQVVHRFSQRHGLISEITPDMCVHVNETVTMGTGDAMGLIAENIMRNIGLQSLPSVALTGTGSSGRAGLAALSSTANAAFTAVDIASNAAGSAMTGLGAILSAHNSRVDAGLGNTRNPLGFTGTFIFRKLLTRSQLGYAFRYSPLVLQGKPMVGGLPIKKTGGSFIQGIGEWFRDTAESSELYLDHLYDTLHPNRWFNNTRGSFKSFITGSERVGVRE